MKLVFKYILTVGTLNTISAPEDAHILHFGNQHEIPCVWMLVDDTKTYMNYSLRVVGTGEILHENFLDHIGTASFSGGSEVYHCFLV